MNLVEIIDKFNLNPTTDKNSVHCYIKGYYEQQFLKYKNKKINFLEIGIRGGGSMKLWSEYFTNAKSIIGIDTDESAIANQFKDIEGVTYYFGDAYTEEIVNKIATLDVFLDDGPHTLESQLDAIKYYLPKVKTGGLFLIEDIQEESWFDILEEKVNELNTNNQYIVERVDLRYMKNMFGDHRYDDLIFSVKVKRK
jgi:cephalosporin hydroxylase